jgi:hypothetical protein
MKKASEVEELEKLITQLGGMHVEISHSQGSLLTMH